MRFFLILLMIFPLCFTSSLETELESKNSKRKKMKTLDSYFGKPGSSGSGSSKEAAAYVDQNLALKLMGVEFDECGCIWFMDDFSRDVTQRLAVSMVGKELTIMPTEEKHCFGIYNLANHTSTPCAKKAKIEQKYRNCYACVRAIGFNPAFYNVCQTTLSDQQKIYNLTPHSVYLAAFSASNIKVGITQTERLTTRLTEQGARLAVILGEFKDAYAARELEESVNKNLGVPDVVTMKKKFELAKGPLEEEERREIEKALLEKFLIVKSQYVLSFDAQVRNFDQYYFRGESLAFDTISSIGKLESPLSGVFVGSIGDVSFLRTKPGNVVKIALKSLLGTGKVFLKET